MGISFTIHAKERAFERYGIMLTPPKWEAFARTIRNVKYSIPLNNERVACFFDGNWYLLACKNDTVLTFLSPEDATDDDKHRLNHDKRYPQTGVDVFRVNESSTNRMAILPLEPPASIPDVELPQDVLDAAAKLMSRLCDRPQE